VYGISSGALKAALFAQRHPDACRRLALDAFVWTGEGSPTLDERKKKLPQFINVHRRPIDRQFVHSIFERDHPGTADDAHHRGVRRRDPRARRLVPTGTYVDMCSKLPLVDPAKITCPRSSCAASSTASRLRRPDRVLQELPNADKQFAVMAGISHASFQQKNYKVVYHILEAFFTQPDPVYRA
jgi:pimeloyl-ACP methyl ester carboxylesterase